MINGPTKSQWIIIMKMYNNIVNTIFVLDFFSLKSMYTYTFCIWIAFIKQIVISMTRIWHLSMTPCHGLLINFAKFYQIKVINDKVQQNVFQNQFMTDIITDQKQQVCIVALLNFFWILCVTLTIFLQTWVRNTNHQICVV